MPIRPLGLICLDRPVPCYMKSTIKYTQAARLNPLHAHARIPLFNLSNFPYIIRIKPYSTQHILLFLDTSHHVSSTVLEQGHITLQSPISTAVRQPRKTICDLDKKRKAVELVAVKSVNSWNGCNDVVVTVIAKRQGSNLTECAGYQDNTILVIGGIYRVGWEKLAGHGITRSTCCCW